MDDKDRKLLQQMRKDIFIAGYKGGVAHLASCFSCLEILYTFYVKKILNYRSDDLKWTERDRLILSKGHAGLALFRVAAEAGCLTMDEFRSYLQPGTRIGGEPCMRDQDFVEATTGSLGHGLSMGVGIAMALKMDGKSANTYVVLGDGEIEEGTVWEAVMSAPFFKLDNLIAVLDCNKIQKMNRTQKVIGVEDWTGKWMSFGWEAVEVDGHDVDKLKDVLSEKNTNGRPKLVVAHTVKGKGVSIMENNPIWHFKLPVSKKEMKCFMEELHVTKEELAS